MALAGPVVGSFVPVGENESGRQGHRDTHQLIKMAKQETGVTIKYGMAKKIVTEKAGNPFAIMMRYFLSSFYTNPLMPTLIYSEKSHCVKLLSSICAIGTLLDRTLLILWLIQLVCIGLLECMCAQVAASGLFQHLVELVAVTLHI